MANLDRVVWQTSFCWHDVIGCMTEKERDAFLALPEEKQNELIEEFSYSIGKGLEWGIMEQWTQVMKDSISDTNLFDRVTKIMIKEGQNE